MNKILDGKMLAQKIKNGLKAEVEILKQKGITPGLAVILVGDNPASKVYVNSKSKDCTELGMYSNQITLPDKTTEKELLDLIDKLNNDKSINGILVQLPLPKHINEKSIINAIFRKNARI